MDVLGNFPLRVQSSSVLPDDERCFLVVAASALPSRKGFQEKISELLGKIAGHLRYEASDATPE